MTTTAAPPVGHTAIEPGILYLGTPVVLISTTNADGSANLAPMSSAFWLGWRGILGLDGTSRTTENLLRTGECVLNLPSADQADAVDRLALTTGADPVPQRKQHRGYRHLAEKFARAGLTPVPSDVVSAPRAAECPVAMEAVVEASHGIGRGNASCFEVRVVRVWVHDDIRTPGSANRIDPDRWRPLIMSFQRFYGLGAQLRPSRLADIPEDEYRTPDIERART
ncbi:flavin reductase (DIM6/NTAB) family NADH-FMN oxidoreductase RutF [Pseudonocardia hierapolitana]|uniref:Flavin reductase (DIM6/NTAB) family NADH-FMN oxidoreductase RutF n=1 Tax=Pseudonocardia hierapolitana TaxID=1128676 RepID=A0A561SYG3_9PSEU|nr:flavin reductase family protein [Pseudonocardia hierapolitana]TWF79915.1 flavin reductase (DIM6/NTAB) family NADH-FMN oxidoreductase RutF [Pseudonocardia hierapolitana]